MFFFYVTILKFVDNFSKGVIRVIPSTFDFRQNLYQGNLYDIFKLNLLSI